MKALLPILFVVHALMANCQAEEFIPQDTIYIGPNREFQSPLDFFDKERSNVQVFIDSGTYYVGDYFYIRGEHIIVEPLGGRVNLYCEELYANVLWLSGEHIVIRGFHMKHFKPGGMMYQNCSGRVVGFDMAKYCTLENCDLNGCGLAGVHDNLGNSNILIRKNHIHNNSVGAYTDINGGVWQVEVDTHQAFTFSNNLIENNGPDRIREADTLFLQHLDSTQRKKFIPIIEDFVANGFGTCLPILEDTINCDYCGLEDLELVVYINANGIAEVLNYINHGIDCDDKSSTLILECIKEYVFDYVSFTEALENFYIRFSFKDFMDC